MGSLKRSITLLNNRTEEKLQLNIAAKICEKPKEEFNGFLTNSDRHCILSKIFTVTFLGNANLTLLILHTNKTT